MKALFGLFILILVSTLPAFAQQGTNAQFGIVYGSSVPDADNTKPYLMTGVKGAAYVYPAWSVGGYYFFSDSSGQPAGEKFKYSLHGVDAAYHVPSGPGEVFFSLRGGFSKVEKTDTGTAVTFSPYHLGFATGYDYLIMPWCAIGFEGSFYHLKKSNTSRAGTDYNLDAFRIINFLVTLQIRM